MADRKEALRKQLILSKQFQVKILLTTRKEMTFNKWEEIKQDELTDKEVDIRFKMVKLWLSAS
ncbi:hypothetical protein [Paenibacillus sp. IITD108]|uniref:hypothetical protein n=1 Tax=Paenibacillus sp. IITD108 TaxID=3116649 RepID=UPI002F420E76